MPTGTPDRRTDARRAPPSFFTASWPARADPHDLRGISKYLYASGLTEQIVKNEARYHAERGKRSAAANNLGVQGWEDRSGAKPNAFGSSAAFVKSEPPNVGCYIAWCNLGGETGV